MLRDSLQTTKRHKWETKTIAQFDKVFNGGTHIMLREPVRRKRGWWLARRDCLEDLIWELLLETTQTRHPIKSYYETPGHRGCPVNLRTNP